MIGRLVGIVTAAALMLTGCASASRSGLADDTQCKHSPHGVVCVVVKTSNAGIADIIGYYSPAHSLTGRTWRLDLVRYDCDPGNGSTCRPAAHYPGPSRSAPPPVDGSCIAVLYDTGSKRCTNRLAQAMASFGDWAGLDHLPLRLTGTSWLCVTAQLRYGRAWQNEFPPAADCYRATATGGR